MRSLFHVDWRSLFVPSSSILEIVIRGTVMYLFLFMLLRILRRETGTIGISDLLVIVIIADAAQNAMAGEYGSITEGMLLVTTIVMWDYALDWLGFRFPWLRRLLRPAPLLLIKDGVLMRRNMRQEMVSDEELTALLREQGIDKVEDVKSSYVEGDGRVSVIRKDGGRS